MQGCRVNAALGTVVCAGAWAGQLLDTAAAAGGHYARLITPLRGHLLQLSASAAPGVPRLHRGAMETQYLKVLRHAADVPSSCLAWLQCCPSALASM